MAPNKLENQIKEKLNSREIQPSAQAWDRLDAMLTVSEEKKTRRPLGFLFIAAGITVLLTVGMFFVTQNGAEIQPKNDVVTSEIKDTLQNQVNETPTAIAGQKEVKVSTETQNPESQTTNNNQRVSISNQKPVITNQQSTNQNPLINREKEIEYQNSSDVALKNLPVIETRKEIVLPKSVPSDEQLLAGLDKTAKQSSDKNSVVKVNPKNLLSQVDGELELTFREKVINKVAKNYKEVKVALANRNNE
ncbi:MAG: hypothetical protein V4535_03020 [Bacteroidota bacterium]